MQIQDMCLHWHHKFEKNSCERMLRNVKNVNDVKDKKVKCISQKQAGWKVGM